MNSGPVAPDPEFPQESAMKQFSFKLEPVLNYRRLVEDGEEHKLRGIQAAILETQRTRDDLGTQIENCGRTLEARSQGTLDMDEVRTLSAYLERLRAELDRTSQVLSKLEQDRKQQLASFLEARREREVVEKLKEDRFSAYRKETETLEQKVLDDLSVSQFGRSGKQDLPTAASPTPKD
jgi:flagellar FliJ protein